MRRGTEVTRTDPETGKMSRMTPESVEADKQRAAVDTLAEEVGAPPRSKAPRKRKTKKRKRISAKTRARDAKGHFLPAGEVAGPTPPDTHDDEPAEAANGTNETAETNGSEPSWVKTSEPYVGARFYLDEPIPGVYVCTKSTGYQIKLIESYQKMDKIGHKIETIPAIFAEPNPIPISGSRQVGVVNLNDLLALKTGQISIGELIELFERSPQFQDGTYVTHQEFLVEYREEAHAKQEQLEHDAKRQLDRATRRNKGGRAGVPTELVLAGYVEPE